MGAYKGEFTTAMRREWDADVIAIEPIPQYFEALEQLLANDPRAEVLPVALGARDGNLRIVLAEDGSSAFGDGADFVEVPVRDVSDVIADREVALLKMNAEGAEFEVLERLNETGQIGQVTCLQVQFHRFAPDAGKRRAEIRRRLSATHRCSWSVPWVWEQWVRREQGSPYE